LFAHADLALSIGLGATVNALCLAFLLKRGGLYQPSPGWPVFILRMLPAVLAVAGMLWYAGQHLDWVALGARPGVRAFRLATVVIGAAMLYFALLFLRGFRRSDFTRRYK